jgi:hypothetical protein
MIRLVTSPANRIFVTGHADGLIPTTVPHELRRAEDHLLNASRTGAFTQEGPVQCPKTPHQVVRPVVRALTGIPFVPIRLHDLSFLPPRPDWPVGGQRGRRAFSASSVALTVRGIHPGKRPADGYATDGGPSHRRSDSHLSDMRLQEDRDDAVGCLSAFLRVRKVRCAPPP